MKLIKSELSFVEERGKLVRYWKTVGPLMCTVFLALVVWLYFRAPLFINPFRVFSRLEEGTLEPSTLILMAGLLPVVVITTLLILAALIFFAFCVIRREKRYLKIIENLQKQEDRNS